MRTLIKNGFVIDPASDREGIYDILIEEEAVKEISALIDVQADMQVIDAEGKYILPGFIDLHVHLREPGFEYKETIVTGAMAAAAGGFTTICAMPNTKPVTDNEELVKLVIDKAKKAKRVNVLPIGAITIGQDGNEMADIDSMSNAGAIALSEDGKSVMDTSLYARAMKKAASLDMPVFAHCEDKSLVGKGVINAGDIADKLKLAGISNAVEDIIVARDILLAKETKARLHLCHCSTKDSVRMLALAKEEGLPVTGEACPHHFTLTDEDIPCDDANYKMNPPLRSREDVRAIIEGLKEGVLDVIATDHAPHSEDEKSRSMSESPFGIVGLETAFAISVTELVKTGYLSLRQLVEKLSTNPARVIGINKGRIQEGCIADFVIADIDKEYTIDKNCFLSKGRNTPFHGKKVFGRILYTFVGGRMVYKL